MRRRRERRAAAETLKAARADLKAAEQTRDGSAQAAPGSRSVLREILPTDVGAARRLTHLKLSQMARERDVTFQRSAASPEEVRGSTLERLRVSYALAGDYNDIRALIYDIETAPDFLVIENVFLSEGADEQAPLTLTLELSTYYPGGAAMLPDRRDVDRDRAGCWFWRPRRMELLRLRARRRRPPVAARHAAPAAPSV